MPFTDFKHPGSVVSTYGLQARGADLFQAAPPRQPSEWLVKQIAFAQARKKSTATEMFAREALIAPALFEVLRDFSLLDIWSNELRIAIDERLSGYPDHIVSALPEPDAIFLTDPRPLLAVAVAKKDDFESGWGQCLAEMVACQLLNGSPDTAVWGIVTTGTYWQFGRLKGPDFALHNKTTDLDPLDIMLGRLHYIFAECQAIAEKWAAVANNGDPSATD